VSYFQHARRHHHSPVPHWLVQFGVLGVFVVSALDASIIPLPIPGSTDVLVVLLAARHSSPWLLVVAAAGGSLLGGYLTWSAGKRGGEAMLERHVPKRFLAALTGWVKRRGVISVATASVLPPPIPLMPFLLAAGALGVTRKQFLWSFAIARTARYAVMTWLGVTYGRHVLRLWSHYLSGWAVVILWVFLGFLAAAILFGIWKYRHDRRSGKYNLPVASGQM
jgi:membrane protein YqaA with SNARE-associated domain